MTRKRRGTRSQDSSSVHPSRAKRNTRLKTEPLEASRSRTSRRVSSSLVGGPRPIVSLQATKTGRASAGARLATPSNDRSPPNAPRCQTRQSRHPDHERDTARPRNAQSPNREERRETPGGETSAGRSRSGRGDGLRSVASRSGLRLRPGAVGANPSDCRLGASPGPQHDEWGETESPGGL